MSGEQRAPEPPAAPGGAGGDLGDSRLTESANPRTATIDRAATGEIVRLLLAEDRAVPEAVWSEASAISRIVEEVTDRFRRGGRLIYVGAGTSGRLGVLDAAECPPTFGTDPRLVQGIIAGGPEALVRSLEGAEDDEAGGREAVREAAVGPRDFVLGIAASSTTPFVRAALEAASAAGAGTGFLCCTPPSPDVASLVDLRVTPLVGPEAIAGSTRLKAGTATKLVLNAITTAAMIRMGKVYGNLMVDLEARSEKLADRSLRIVSAVTGADRQRARRLLIDSGGSTKTAIVMERLGASRWQAERCLDACDGFLGLTLERFAAGPPPLSYALYPDSGPDGAFERLRERLAASEALLADALDEAAGEGSVPESARRHVAHLLAFETEAVGPRLVSWGPEAGGEPTFDDWEDQRWFAREAKDPADLLARFAEARRQTLRLIDACGPALPRKGARLGKERFTAFQMLRGVAHHDEAHIRRIRERLHSSLLGGGPE